MAPKVTQIRVRVSDELLARIEHARGLVPREPWMRRALDRAAREELEAMSREVVPAVSPKVARDALPSASPRTPGRGSPSSSMENFMPKGKR